MMVIDKKSNNKLFYILHFSAREELIDSAYETNSPRALSTSVSLRSWRYTLLSTPNSYLAITFGWAPKHSLTINGSYGLTLLIPV